MSSVHPRRAPRGQARLEVSANRLIIEKIANKSANLKDLWETLTDTKKISIAYTTFCKAYRDEFPDIETETIEDPSPPRIRESRTRAAKQRPLAQEAQANAQTKVKPKPSQPIIGTFTHNPNSEGVGDKW